MKKLLLLLLLIPLVASSAKNIDIPEDMKVYNVPFTLGCFDSFNRMKHFLLTMGETPKFHMDLRKGHL